MQSIPFGRHGFPVRVLPPSRKNSMSLSFVSVFRMYEWIIVLYSMSLLPAFVSNRLLIKNPPTLFIIRLFEKFSITHFKIVLQSDDKYYFVLPENWNVQVFSSSDARGAHAAPDERPGYEDVVNVTPMHGEEEDRMSTLPRFPNQVHLTVAD